ncbi:MAG: gatB [Gammaproteobacteria bacterium]|nr:gatB [Gammaproteobacteria bacterium]
MAWETVIGLEIHVQLSTRSKIFSGAATAYGAPPNTQACAIDLGLPGVLPVLNVEAVRKAIKFGLAIEATIANHSVFARKNYFYPDLPKGYQISQYEMPIVSRGKLAIILDDGTSKTIGITRAHLEEDAGKSLHEDFHGMTGIDLNRAGTALLEIVSEPEMRSAREAAIYMKKVHTLVRYLNISDGNMQEGSFRCDANVSIRPMGEAKLGTRTEIKNLNSFRFVEQAILHEINRQREILETGGQVAQETRLYDPDRNETRTMRSKEEANDYRYFPDPDLLTVAISPGDIELIRVELPELPDAKRQRFIGEYALTEYDSDYLTANREIADYFEQTASAALTVYASASQPHNHNTAKLSANTIMGELSAALNKHNLDITSSPVSPEMLGGMIRRIEDNTISGKIAKQVFEAMWNGEGDADTIIASRGLRQVTDSGMLEALVTEVINAYPDQVDQYRAGKDKVLGFLVGQIMKKSQGKANPQQVNDILREKLKP